MSARCRRHCFRDCGSASWSGRSPSSKKRAHLRRLMVRHAPNNNQRTAALFLSLGHHDTLIRRLHTRLSHALGNHGRGACRRICRQSARIPTFGGTSFWVEGPTALDSEMLADSRGGARHLDRARADQFRRATIAPRNFFRLAFSSIEEKKIEPGIKPAGRNDRRAASKQAGGMSSLIRRSGNCRILP